MTVVDVPDGGDAPPMLTLSVISPFTLRWEIELVLSHVYQVNITFKVSSDGGFESNPSAKVLDAIPIFGSWRRFAAANTRIGADDHPNHVASATADENSSQIGTDRIALDHSLEMHICQFNIDGLIDSCAAVHNVWILVVVAVVTRHLNVRR
jgi:hypothetical protein